MIGFIFFAILFLFLSIGIVFASTVEVIPSKDARVEESDGDRNFGDSVNLIIRSNSDDDKRTFLKFDLPALPERSSIVSAFLKLLVFDAPGEDRTYELNKILVDWIEGNGGTDNDPAGEITWNNQPNVNSTLTATFSSGTAAGVNLTVDVSDDVKNFYAGNFANNGWRIKDSVEDKADPGRETIIRSREAGSPILEINFVSCGISLSKSSISFGSVSPNEESDEDSLIVNNVGTDTASLSISGTDWSSLIPVERTRFSTFSSNYDSKTSLLTSDQTITSTLEPNSPLEIFFRFKAGSSDPAGVYSQTINFISSC